MTPGELLALHTATLFQLDIDGRMYANNTATFEAAPRFYLGRCAEGTVALVRDDVPPQIAADLLELASSEPPHTSPRAEPRFAELYVELLSEDAPITLRYFGPAFALPGGAWLPEPEARMLSAQDSQLFAPHFAWLAQEIETWGPVLGIVRDGMLVAQCGCSRLSLGAAEAGLEVAEPYRGQGFAKDCTAAWAAHIRETGRVAMYSTWWENEASLAVAGALGFEQYGTDWHVR